MPSTLPVPTAGVHLDGEFSRIVIREEGTVRTLYFVDEQGREHIESRLDLARPERLLLPYARAMFTSYLFVPEPKRVLVIGVGAGSMIRFLTHHDPNVEIDAVDIDPVVLDVARDYFGTRESERVHLIVQDGFDFIDETSHRYDVIFLDAFLKPFADADSADPAVDTDASGVPRRLKTIETYRGMQDKLTPGGVVVVNLHYHTVEDDVATLRSAFARGHLFEVPGSGNFILVGTSDEAVPTQEALAERGQRVDLRLGADFSFSQLGRRLLSEVPRAPAATPRP